MSNKSLRRRDGSKSMPGPTASMSATPPDIGRTIAALRKSRGLSLDQLGELSGVSKSMLSKIERSQTNPTLGTVWRLASTFQVGIEKIIANTAPETPISRRRAYEIPTLKSADGGCTIRILSPIEMASVIEWYDITAEPQSSLESAAHGPSAVEHITMIEGTYTVESGDKVLEVSVDETASYPADVPHALRNFGTGRARAIVIVTYHNEIRG